MPGCVLTRDPETVRGAARRMLRYMLSLRQSNWNTDSGLVANVAADAIGADRFLPTMATDEFLSCLSKPEMERVAQLSGVLPRQTGKATRAAVLERFKDERFIYPDASFAISEEARLSHAAAVKQHAQIQADTADDDDTEDAEADPGDEPENGEIGIAEAA